MTDCVACSFASVMYGKRLRVKGENQENGVGNLRSNLPKLTSAYDKIRLTFDRGYGKIETKIKGYSIQ